MAPGVFSDILDKFNVFDEICDYGGKTAGYSTAKIESAVSEWRETIFNEMVKVVLEYEKDHKTKFYPVKKGQRGYITAQEGDIVLFHTGVLGQPMKLGVIRNISENKTTADVWSGKKLQSLAIKDLKILSYQRSVSKEKIDKAYEEHFIHGGASAQCEATYLCLAENVRQQCESELT